MHEIWTKKLKHISNSNHRKNQKNVGFKMISILHLLFFSYIVGNTRCTHVKKSKNIFQELGYVNFVLLTWLTIYFFKFICCWWRLLTNLLCNMDRISEFVVRAHILGFTGKREYTGGIKVTASQLEHYGGSSDRWMAGNRPLDCVHTCSKIEIL